jgi:3-oxoacyl-[acyl-carrier protein] reductase
MSKYLVITGGSRGIGKAVITRFLAEGWHAINLSRTACDIDGVTNLEVDLGNPEWPQQQHSTLRDLTRNAAQICLVHNASTYNKDDMKSLSAKDMRLSLEVNILSPLALNQLLLPQMSAGSSIIYVGSTLSEMAVAGRASYVMSKHALVGMMRATCQDLQGKGISTCCICPGFVNTNMLTSQADKAMLDQFIKSKVTAGRLIETAEIAELIYFSANNPVMNGSVLHANLGQITS